VRRRRLCAATAVAMSALVALRPARADVDEALADFKAGRYLEASAEIQAVVDQKPAYDYGYFLLGHCMLKMRRAAEAQIQFRRALSLNPTRAEYYHGFALALNASGNWPLMIRAATEGVARATDPHTRSALLALRAYAWSALRRWSFAVRDLEEVQRTHAEPWVPEFLGKARFASGAWADAIPPLRQALEAAPEDPVVLRLLAECCLRLAADERDSTRKKLMYEQSLEYAQRLVSVSPSDLDAVNLVGRAALGAGRLAQAENVFRHVIGINPRQCFALANLGRTYMAAARWAEAEAYLRRASACAPRLPTVYESLGELYLQLGEPQEAAAAFRRAEEIEPTHAPPDPDGSIRVFQPR
jgi:tetratricopeptide (TPR) repeat protein